jgi:type IV pilus assembly protein PilW
MCAERLPQRKSARRAQRGLSIVELMIGIVIAMLVAIAASGAAIFFNSAQRQGMGTNGALINTTTSLAALKEDLAQVGLGFFGESTFLCSNLNLSVAGNNYSVNSFSPLQVVRGGNFDQVDVVYANEVAGGANVRLKSATGSLATLESYLPAAVGSAVIFAKAPPSSGRCTVRTVTQVTPATTDVPETISYDSTGSHNQVAFATPETYGSGDRVALLGDLSWQRYRVTGGNLVVERRFDNTSATLIRNVVAFRVQYGVTAVGDTTIADWVDPSGTTWATLTPATLPRVRAVRIGVVTRSTQMERRDASGNCVATEVTPSLFGDEVSGLPADWGCYRYRSATMTVPLRNVALGLRSGA